MKLHIDIDVKVSRFIKFFIISDLFFLGGWGFVDPIFSVFVVENIKGATLVTAGITAAIYWIVKSIIQIPVANFLDKTDGERDDFYVLIASLFLTAISAFLLVLVNEVWQLLAVQVVHAVAFGFYLPAWTGMFSRHLDKGHEALDWSLNSTTVGIASGITGFASGAFAQWFGFNMVFVLAGVFSLIAALVIMFTPDVVFPKRKNIGQEVFIKNHSVSK